MNQDVSRSDARSSYSQSERLAQIGLYLQQLREDQGLLIDQVATKTMISARHIRAIESGDLATLPEAIYVRGFIKRYAEVLGLNGTEIADNFPLYSDDPTIKPTWQTSDVAQLRQTHLYLAYVALITSAVIGLGVVLERLNNGDRPSRSDPSLATPGQELPQAEAPEVPSAPSATPDAVKEPSEPNDAADPAVDLDGQVEPDLATILNSSESDGTRPASRDPLLSDKPVTVELDLKERSWLRVTVDGQVDFEGVLPEGTQRTWAADDAVVVRVGNAGGVLVAFNGSEAEVMGEPGSVQERLFSANTAESSTSEE